MQAIILAAGAGVRLREAAPVKPLAPIAGKPLIVHVAERLFSAGVDAIIVVLGYRAAQVDAALQPLRAAGRPVLSVVNSAWDAPNGVSVLAAAPHVRGRALLTMADHLVEPALYARVAAAEPPDPGALVLGVDRRLGHPWVDADDVTRVATDGDRITAIGKLLQPFDAYDTGVFATGDALFEALGALERPSLSDGVRSVAAAGRAHVVDCGELAWLDVDDPRAFALAQGWAVRPATRLAAGR